MTKRLLIVDGDGTISEVKNPFYEMAKTLSCYSKIRQYAELYLANVISYEELILRQNPVFKKAGRKYATEHGYEKLDPDLFKKLLYSILGSELVSQPTRAFLDRVRRTGYEIALISSGWDAVIYRAAREAEISYWRANEVLFEDGEFSGTIVRVSADKIQEFEAAVAAFDIDYQNVIYIGDSEFDVIAMKFICHKGGESCLYKKDYQGDSDIFPPNVKRFPSLEHMGDYIEMKARE